MLPITIDFEASCLPRHGRSFPIEVGIADARGNSRAWLIRPHASWNGWTWTEEAESLHRITPALLEREGLPACVVLSELCHAIGGREVIADSSLDAVWLTTLSRAAGIPADFSIVNLSEVLAGMAPTAEQLLHADACVERFEIRQHRAAQDARHLALWLTALRDRMGENPVMVDQPPLPALADG